MHTLSPSQFSDLTTAAVSKSVRSYRAQTKYKGATARECFESFLNARRIFGQNDDGENPFALSRPKPLPSELFRSHIWRHFQHVCRGNEMTVVETFYPKHPFDCTIPMYDSSRTVSAVVKIIFEYFKVFWKINHHQSFMQKCSNISIKIKRWWRIRDWGKLEVTMISFFLHQNLTSVSSGRIHTTL